MATVRIDALTLGAVLAKDVKNSEGQLLLRTGVSVQERHLMLLKSWGITEVEIQGGASDKPASGQPLSLADSDKAKRLSEIKEDLREKFRHNNLHSPVMSALFDLCALRKGKLLK